MTQTAKSLLIVCCFGLLCSITSRNAKADERDKKTILTFSGPVQIQNARLEAGTYVFKLADTTDRHVIQIFNQDENRVIATILAIPDYRLKPTGKTVIKRQVPLPICRWAVVANSYQGTEKRKC